ncbi:4Fe-4S binding protein [bacterium]|nr:4Fe-4S binding protein [FCB group bacterium]MBL7190641.1 4Fe-4S binding protein [bacterium]
MNNLQIVTQFLSLPQEISDTIRTGFSVGELALLAGIIEGKYKYLSENNQAIQKLLNRQFIVNKEGEYKLVNSHKFICNYIVFYRDTIDPDKIPVFDEFFSREMSQHNVKTYEQIKDYIKKAEGHWVIPCVCRVFHNNCDNPKKICMGLVKDYEYEGAERLSLEKALKIAEKSEENNLVPTYFDMTDGGGWLCFCCGCCCMPIRKFLRTGEGTVASGFIQYTSMEECAACGDCVAACQFSARMITDDELIVDDKLCLGCGVCIDDCPSEAISLVSR